MRNEVKRVNATTQQSTLVATLCGPTWNENFYNVGIDGENTLYYSSLDNEK